MSETRPPRDGPDSGAGSGRRRAWRRRPPLQSVGTDPDYRFSLANERTFLAHLRTALALLASGVALAQLAPDVGDPRLRAATSALLVVLGLALAATSAHRWRRTEEALRRAEPLPTSRVPLLLGNGVALAAVLVLVAVVSEAWA